MKASVRKTVNHDHAQTPMLVPVADHQETIIPFADHRIEPELSLIRTGQFCQIGIDGSISEKAPDPGPVRLLEKTERQPTGGIGPGKERFPRIVRMKVDGQGGLLRRQTGSRNVNTLPCPKVLSTATSPLWASMMCLTMARPSPVPPSWRLRAWSVR